MERVTVSLDPDLLAAFDAYLGRAGYVNRSEGLRDVLRDFLAEERLNQAGAEEGRCVGCVVYMYNHRERTLSTRLMETQHHHHEIPAATLHLHIDQEHCLEATVLQGRVSEVRHMAEGIISQTGVKHGRLHIIPV